jgi:hypothetical protein
VTFRHRAGVSPYTSSCDLAEACVFGKQSLGPFLCGLLELRSARDLHPTEAPLLPKLRGHFAEFLNEGSSDRLGILYLPTCVGFGTGTPVLPRRFSWRHGFRNFAHAGSASRLSLEWVTDFPITRPTRLPQVDHRLGFPSLPRPAFGQANGTWYRNINLLSIAYAFRPRLRSRLTLSRLALLRNPWAFGGGVSRSSFVTHASILTSQRSTAGFRRRLTAMGTLPYHSTQA